MERRLKLNSRSMRVNILVLLIWAPSLIHAENFPLYRATIIERPHDLGIVINGALNDHGQVAYTFLDSEGERGYLWDGQTLNELPNSISASDINNEGKVVGAVTTDSGPRAAIWLNGQITNLGILAGDIESLATGINDSGVVVGQSMGDSYRSAVLWKDGPPLPIGDFYPRSINDLEEVIGDIPGGGTAIWANDTLTLQAIGTWTPMNNSGQYGTNGAFWDGEEWITFPTLGESYAVIALGLNEHGQVVGTDDNEAEAFIWQRDQGLAHLIDLLDSTDPFSDSITNMQFAFDINNKGQIFVFWATRNDGAETLSNIPLLLTPLSVSPQYERVPVPIFALAILAALFVLTAIRAEISRFRL